MPGIGGARIILGRSATLRYFPESRQIVKILSQYWFWTIPEESRTDCVKIVKILNSDHFRGSSENAQKVVPERPKYCQNIVKKYSRTTFRQYFDKIMVAAFGRSQKRGGGVHILSTYCQKIVLEYVLTTFWQYVSLSGSTFWVFSEDPRKWSDFNILTIFRQSVRDPSGMVQNQYFDNFREFPGISQCSG